MATKQRTVKKSDTSVENKSEKEILIQIDYPREMENVGVGHYAVRISAQAGSDVEISCDKGPWGACRYAAGHWWFDWYPTEKGAHAIIVRARGVAGKWQQSKEVRFQVVGN